MPRSSMVSTATLRVKRRNDEDLGIDTDLMARLPTMRAGYLGGAQGMPSAEKASPGRRGWIVASRGARRS